MNKNITVLVVEPGRKPRQVTMAHTLENLQEIVGGHIQAIYPWKDHAALVCNDDGVALDLPFNRYVRERGYGPIMGNFFICGLGCEDFISLTEEQIARYAQRFALAEMIFLTAEDRVAVIPIPPLD